LAVSSLPCPAEEGSDRLGLVGTWCPVRVNPPQRRMVRASKYARVAKESIYITTVYP